ncbi:MAG: energy transducer TonB [Bacteroidia bacterium]
MQPIQCPVLPPKKSTIVCPNPVPCIDPVRDLTAPDAIYYPNEVKTVAMDKGGIKRFMDFIKDNIDTRKLKLPIGKHRAFYSFVVEKDGSLSTIKILKSPDKALGTMITQAVEKAPKWTPATNAKGQNVRLQFSIPYSFEIK